MAKRDLHPGHYDAALGEFVFHTLYNFSKFKPKIERHFRKGGAYSLAIIAGICNVSKGTIWCWVTPNNDYYHREFHELICQERNIAAKITENAHRKAGLGETKILNEKILMRRYEKICEGIDVKIKSTASYAEKLRVYTESYLRNEINTEVYQALTKGMPEREVEAAIERMEKLLEKQSVKHDKK